MTKPALYTPEAEEAVLGSVLINSACMPEAQSHLGNGPDSAARFYLHHHRWIWDALTDLSRSNSTIDFITVSDYLERKNQLNELPGGRAYLTQLINAIPTSLHVSSYAEIVAADFIRRRLIEAATAIVGVAHQEGRDINDIISDSESALRAAIAGHLGGGGSIHISEAAQKLYDEIKERHEDPKDIFGLATGFKDVDYILGGLQFGETLLISGVPGVGKSLLADQFCFSIAHHQAANGGAGIIYSFEMGVNQVLRRQLSAMTGVGTRPMRTGRLEDKDWPAIVQSVNELYSDYNLHIADIRTMPYPTTATLHADLKRKKNDCGTKFFVVDYLEKLKDEFGKNDKDYERTAKISDRLREIAQKEQMAGLIIQRGNKTGMTAQVMRAGNIGGSSQIVYDADVVGILNQFTPANEEEKRSVSESEKKNLVTLIFDKIREDETGQRHCHLVRRPGLPAFADYAPDPLSSVKSAVRQNGNGRHVDVEHV